MCPPSTWQKPGNSMIEKEGCGVLLKLVAPSIFEVSRELYLRNVWKSGEGQLHLTVMTLSATLLQPHLQ